jgi:geranylgeranyl pyrophosphate synthase
MAIHFQDYVESLRPSLDTAFTGHLARLLGDVGSLHPGVRTKILAGGKKIRGSLLCLVTGALGGALEDALPRAVAIELIQSATLVHDDFVDQHRLRRDSAALWTLEGARRAVLLGDIIFASAIHMMSEMGRADGVIVSRAIAEVSRGAYQEPLNPTSLLGEIEAHRVDAALYEKIIHLKTGVLFGAACQLGAVAAKADDKLQQEWRRYGLRIGEAYQIADDLQEVARLGRAPTATRADVVALAPALLVFVPKMRPRILKALKRRSSAMTEELVAAFEEAAKLMREEIERRLRSALAAIDGDLPDTEAGRLSRVAPWDLIGMFNEADRQISSR